MTYFEYSLNIDKLDLVFELNVGNLLNDNIYQESVGSFFSRLSNIFSNYIDDHMKLHSLYKEKKNLDKNIKYIEKLCKINTIAKQEIVVRGYNGKIIEPLNIEDDVQSLKNIIAYATVKQKDPLISEYLERYEVYKAGWDTFYKVKIKDIPAIYQEVSKKLDESIDTLKSTIKDLSHYFENSKINGNYDTKNIFKLIITKIKNSVTRDINIITMNFEAMQYEIGKKFKKITEETSKKVIKTNISDLQIRKNSTFIKEITYGNETYKIYESTYKNISAMNYGGSLIYVENDFFKLPRGYQLAILYHEIGHHQCKHFKPIDMKTNKVNKNIDIELEDTSEIVKRIKKDYTKFVFKLMTSPYYNDEKYLNGEEFIYLLVEWEADRFSANIVGKQLMKKALNTHFSDILKSNPQYKNNKKNKLHYKYNMDRMRIRTNNI